MSKTIPITDITGHMHPPLGDTGMKAAGVVQNVDRIIRQRDYDKFGDSTLLVTSFFRTIQGEGPYAGWPAVFLRLAGCNFGDKSDHCQWCDTSFQFDQGKTFNFNELSYELTHLPGYRETDILVITGGEPTLQHNLVPFMIGASSLFKRIQIETNGTQPSFFALMQRYEESMYPTTHVGRAKHLIAEALGEPDADRYVRPSVVVSPKASNKASRTPELAELVQHYASCLKFVVTADPEDPQHEIPDWALSMQAKYGTLIYVSPMAVYLRPYAGEVSSAWDATLIDQEATAANYAYAAQYAMQHGFLLSIQGHLFTAIP